MFIGGWLSLGDRGRSEGFLFLHEKYFSLHKNENFGIKKSLFCLISSFAPIDSVQEVKDNHTLPVLSPSFLFFSKKKEEETPRMTHPSSFIEEEKLLAVDSGITRRLLNQ